MNAPRICKLRNGVNKTPQFFFFQLQKFMRERDFYIYLHCKKGLRLSRDGKIDNLFYSVLYLAPNQARPGQVQAALFM